MCKVFVRPRSDQDGMNERGTATLASSVGKVLLMLTSGGPISQLRHLL